MPKRKPKKLDLVEIIYINQEWLDIEPTAEDLLGETGMITDVSFFEGFGQKYQIEIPDKISDKKNTYRRLWLSEEWFKILDWE